LVTSKGGAFREIIAHQASYRTPFRDFLDSLIWNVFAQVAYIPSERKSVQSDVSLPEGTPSQKVNSIDESLRDTFDAFREIEKIATGVSYPAISIIPIAIYR
jgi:hypothetical protein